MSIKIAFIFLFLSFIASCTMYPIFNIESEPFLSGVDVEKIDSTATVVIKPTFNNYVLRGKGWAYAYKGLGKSTVQMVEQVFANVNVSEIMPEPGGQHKYQSDLILVPEVIGIKEWHNKGVSLNLTQQIILGWKVYAYPSLKLIYQTQAAAQEKSYAGSMLNVESQSIKRAKLAVAAVLKQSFNNLSVAYQLHQYASISALINASEQTRISTAQSLLAKNTSIKTGRDMLNYSVDIDDYKLATALLNAGVGVNTLDERRGGLVQHIAVKKQNQKMIMLLLDHGANINAPDLFGKNLLHYAVQFNNTNLITELFQRGAHVTTLNNNADESFITGKSYLNFASYQEGIDSNLIPSKTYAEARANFEKATIQYQQQADNMSGLLRSAQFKRFFLQALGGAVLQYGVEKQAQLQVKQWQQFTALQSASNNEAGLNGYYRNLRYLNSQSQVTLNANQALPNIGHEESLDNQQMQQWVAIYKDAAANSGQIIHNIDKRVKCLTLQKNKQLCPRF